MTDLTQVVQAGYRGDASERPAYASSADWCGYVAGMAHRLAGGQFPVKASMGRGYSVNIGTRKYNAYGPECQTARLTLVASQRAEAQTA